MQELLRTVARYIPGILRRLIYLARACAPRAPGRTSRIGFEHGAVVRVFQDRSKSAQELIAILVDAVKNFSKDMPQHDDMTVVVIKNA